MVECYQVILSILFCTSSNFYLGEPCSLFVYGVKVPANRTVRRVTSDRIQDVIFFSVAARLIPLSGQCVQIPSHSRLVYLLLAKPLPVCAAHQAFTDNHPENHAPAAFATRHRLELFLTLNFRSASVWFDPRREQWWDIWLLCTLCTACCNKDSRSGSGFAYEKYLTWFWSRNGAL